MAFARQYQRFVYAVGLQDVMQSNRKGKDRTKQSLATKRGEGEEGVIGALQFLRGLSTDFRT